jgi:hypothetical protein
MRGLSLPLARPQWLDATTRTALLYPDGGSSAVALSTGQLRLRRGRVERYPVVGIREDPAARESERRCTIVVHHIFVGITSDEDMGGVV